MLQDVSNLRPLAPESDALPLSHSAPPPLKKCHIHLSGAMGQTTPGVIFFQKYKSSVNLAMCCKFFPFNYPVTVFPIQTHRRPNLSLPYKRLMSTYGHHLYKLFNARVPHVACQVSRSENFWFWRIFKVFTRYAHGGHLGHVIWTIYTKFRTPSQGGST